MANLYADCMTAIMSLILFDLVFAASVHPIILELEEDEESEAINFTKSGV